MGLKSGDVVAAAQAWLHSGIVLEKRRELADAEVAFREALARKPDCLDALMRLGSVLLLLGRPVEAIGYWRAAAELDPEYEEPHIRLGWAYQLIGEPDRGWDESAALFSAQRINHWRALEQPMWDGDDLSGKTILFWAGYNYGLGDTLHLVRFARHLQRRGARVIVECQRELFPIVKHAVGAGCVVVRGAPLPAFDVHSLFMWVPVVDRTARELRSEDVPYLRVDEHRAERWRERLRALPGRKVGVRWGGPFEDGDVYSRFMRLSALAPLRGLDSAGISLVSLQTGPPARELSCAPAGLGLHRVFDGDAEREPSIAETAALISELDLIISVDTMIAHLAGALDKRTWTLLPHAADWKWRTGDTTPWYPSMRLFRQTIQGDWTPIVEQVRAALAAGE